MNKTKILGCNEKNAFGNYIDEIKKDVDEICNSGNFFVTEDIGREFNTIAHGLDHLKLESDLMSNSADWQKGFDSSSSNKHEVLNLLATTLFNYRSSMEITTLHNCQESEIRQRHDWAVQALKSVEQELSVFTHGAADRIKQFGNQVGVTDLFTGYRNNLTRGSREPIKMETSWMDKSTQWGQLMSGYSLSHSSEELGQGRAQRSTDVFGTTQSTMVDTTGFQSLDSQYPHSDAAKAMNASVSDIHGFTPVAHGHKILSIQEQAGINLTFPGETEYMTRYNTDNL